VDANCETGRINAHRSFLCTYVHEICHHLGYILLRPVESIHTEGFYKRESNLRHQVGIGWREWK